MKLGTGIFTWTRGERISDRYGYFYLDSSDYENTAHCPAKMDRVLLKALAGHKVRIRCRVLQDRESGHIGDFFRGIGPTRPTIGEVVDLGIGSLSVLPPSRDVNAFQIGLEPDDGRDTDWLDPRKLYRLHDQTVEVEIEPA